MANLKNFKRVYKKTISPKQKNIYYYLKKRGYKMADMNYVATVSGAINGLGYCVVENEIIYSQDFTGAKTAVGVPKEKYNLLVNEYDKYYNLCIEHGIIKTQQQIEKEAEEERIKEKELIKSMAQNMEAMRKELAELKSQHAQNGSWKKS